MTLRQLNYFLAIVKCDKYTTAANELYISQSSLSKQILSLERELGVKLFNRNTRNIELTPIGNQLVACAQQIVSEYEKMDLLIREYKEVQKERIAIGALPVLNCYGITDGIISFEKRYSGAKIDITETDTASIFQMLDESKINIGIVRTESAQQLNYNITPLCEDELVLLVGNKHRFADRKIVTLEETATEEFLLFNSDPIILKYYERLFKDAGIAPKIRYSNMRLATIGSLIKQDMMVTLIMKRVAESYNDSMLHIVMLDNHPARALSLLTRKNDLPDFCNIFVKHLVNYKNSVIR
jgi:LysR family transcriptional activator of glutamate synthase operon